MSAKKENVKTTHKVNLLMRVDHVTKLKQLAEIDQTSMRALVEFALDGFFEIRKEDLERANAKESLPGVKETADKVMTLIQACDFLQLSESTVRRMVYSKQIPSRQIGRQYRFLKSELIDWLKFPRVIHNERN